MEPTNGSVSWGRSAWEFLHGMTLDPLASPQAKEAQKKLLLLLRCTLPCPNCRKSYRRFSRDLENVPADQMGDFVADMHDCVNIKLDKPAATFPGEIWKEKKLAELLKKGYPSYVEDMFFFLFTIAANYPLVFTQDTQVFKKYKDFFETLPAALEHRPWGQRMKDYVERNPLSRDPQGPEGPEGPDGPFGKVLEISPLSGRAELMRWLYGLYAEIMPNPQSFDTITSTMESMRK